jgi:alpha-glucosidase (family GH31 glycosyl hydrolase)
MRASGAQDAATGKQAPVFRAPFWEGSTINFTSQPVPTCPTWCPAGGCDPAVVSGPLPGQGCNTSAYYPELYPHEDVPHNMYIMDPFNPDARQFVFEQMKKNYMAYGIKTFWLDEAEPERHTQDIGTRFGYHDGTDAQIGLAWARAEQQMVYEGLHDSGVGDDDIFMLSRSFFIGGAKYGAGAWSGDIQSSFDELHRQVRIGQNVALSGIHWWTTDM